MILLQITIFITIICMGLCYSYMIITPCLLIGNLPIINYIKILGQSIFTLFILNGFNAKLKLIKQSTNTTININNLINENINLIDIIICNHISAVDIPILITYLKQFNIDSYNFVLKNQIVYTPGLGLIMYSNTDIKVNRNWNEDKKTIGKQLDKINNNKKQVIIIFPEGTRLNDKKLKVGQQFSINNKLPVFKNLLVPKLKGLQSIITNLKKTNKLGKIWDTTLIISKYTGKTVHLLDLFGKSIDDIFMEWKQVQLPNNYTNNDIFKNWLFDLWIDKDKLIQNYKQYEYEDINPINNIKISETIFIIITLLISIGFITNKYGRYYLLCSLILAYLLIIFKL